MLSPLYKLLILILKLNFWPSEASEKQSEKEFNEQILIIKVFESIISVFDHSNLPTLRDRKKNINEAGSLLFSDYFWLIFD